MREKSLRNDQVQIVLRAGHGDVKETALFLDFCGAASGTIGRQTAVNGVQKKHGFPLLSLCRMNGRKNQIVFIEEWNASLVAGGIGRVQGEFGQKPFTARVAGRDLPKLYEVIFAAGNILVHALKVRR